MKMAGDVKLSAIVSALEPAPAKWYNVLLYSSKMFWLSKEGQVLGQSAKLAFKQVCTLSRKQDEKKWICIWWLCHSSGGRYPIWFFALTSNMRASFAELLLTSTSKIPFSIYKPFGLATLFTSGQITCNLFCSLAQAAKERLDGKPVLGTIIDVAFQQHAVAGAASLISMNNRQGAWRRPLWSTQYKWPGQHKLSKSGKCLVHSDRCTCQQSVNIWALNEDSPWKEARTKEGQAVEETRQRETERNSIHCSHFGGLLLPCCHAANNVGETTTWVSLRPPGVEFHRVACQIPVSLH